MQSGVDEIVAGKSTRGNTTQLAPAQLRYKGYWNEQTVVADAYEDYFGQTVLVIHNRIPELEDASEPCYSFDSQSSDQLDQPKHYYFQIEFVQ